MPDFVLQEHQVSQILHNSLFCDEVLALPPTNGHTTEGTPYKFAQFDSDLVLVALGAGTDLATPLLNPYMSVFVDQRIGAL